MGYLGAVFTDLDGTLLGREHQLCSPNRTALDWLASRKILRTIATGRSLFSAQKVLAPDFPIDYLIFSSGAGLLHWPSQSLIQSHSLNSDQIDKILTYCLNNQSDFMLHLAVPNNHHFIYHQHSANNPDFSHRLELYQNYAIPYSAEQIPTAASEVIIIEPPERVEARQAQLAQVFPELSLIRCTSPLDHQSGWLELFPPQVSKSQAAQALLEYLTLETEFVMAIGNDYNDLDMLHWAPQAYLVRNAPPPLHGQFVAVAEHHRSGFAEAVKLWAQTLTTTSFHP